MAGRTLSAYTDEATFQRVSDLAHLEDRSAAQIAAAALRFYVRLPSAARDAIRRLEARDEPALIDEAAWAAGRALIDSQFDQAMATGLLGVAEDPAPDLTEDGILAEAVALTRRR